MKVHLRKRKQTKTGSVSLYLEYYNGTTQGTDGKRVASRKYEYLDLYLVDNPTTSVDRQKNKEVLTLAEAIKAKKEVEIKNGHFGFTDTSKQKANFIHYYSSIVENRKESLGNYGNWKSSLKHLIDFEGDKVLFKDIDKDFCERFSKYLANSAQTKSEQKLSASTAASYFVKFRTCLKKAVQDGILLSSPCDSVPTPKTGETEKEYLTEDELRKVANTDCRYNILKNAFIFSCLTGLRWSDIQKLQWSEVKKADDGWKIVFNQQKTKDLQYHEISDQAFRYMGEMGSPQERVFTGLKYSSYSNVELTRWMLKAGITKHITFHCARHTFAVLQLTLGTDIYTVSKLLGHKNLKTTEVYSKIVSSVRRQAVNRMPELSGLNF